MSDDMPPFWAVLSIMAQEVGLEYYMITRVDEPAKGVAIRSI